MSIADQINWTQPINWTHSLMKGVSSRWKAVPKRAGWGSGTWRDLVQRSQKHGTLSGPKWAGGLRNGFGSLSFDGTDDHVELPANIFTGTSLSISLVAKINVIDSYQCLFSVYTSEENCMEIFVNSANATLFFGLFTQVGATNSIVAGGTYHIVLTCAGTALILYLNGKQNATGTSSGFSTYGINSYLGRRSGSSFPFNGSLDDLIIWPARVLSAGDVAKLHEAISRRDDPMLNWLDDDWFASEQAAAAATVSMLPLLGVG